MRYAYGNASAPLLLALPRVDAELVAWDWPGLRSARVFDRLILSASHTICVRSFPRGSSPAPVMQPRADGRESELGRNSLERESGANVDRLVMKPDDASQRVPVVLSVAVERTEI